MTLGSRDRSMVVRRPFKLLTSFVLWLVVAILGVVALLTVGRVVVRRFGRYLPLRRDPLNGDGYEIHDSQEERD